MDAKYFVEFPTSTFRASRPAYRHRGITLIELVLALGLSVIVMGLISMAISLNFRMYDEKRTSIEEAQLARSLLRHIADDIRAAVQHMPPDLSGLETVAGNSQNASALLGGSALGALAGGAGQGSESEGGDGQSAGANQPSGGQSGGDTGTGGGSSGGGSGLPMTTPGGTTGGVNPQTEQAGSTYGEEQAGGIIGLYGSSTELQLDISRLPRVDQYQSELSTDGIGQVVDIPSDMKTVSYFLRPEEGMLDVGIDGRGRGLMRHVLDRAVARWAQESGSAADSMGELELLAEEVVGLQFMYFDGTAWSSDWDSASMKGLPVAIEITLSIQGEAGKPTNAPLNPLAATADGEAELERYYTLTVNLPTATSAEEKQQQSEAEETALSQTGEIDASGDAAAAGALGGGLGGAGGFPGMGGGGPGAPGGGSGGGRGGDGPGDGRGDSGGRDGQGGGRGNGTGGQGPGGGQGPRGGGGNSGGFGGGRGGGSGGGMGGGRGGGPGGGRGGFGGGRGR